MKKGILYGVSTGPGDPELITVKAVKCIESSQVIAAPRTRGENTMALDIVKNAADISGKEIIYLEFTMARDKKVLEESHRQQADQVKKYLDKGMDVALLNIGDASLFGTWCYIRDLIAEDGYQTVTIPGVTSFCAVAAELGKSLTTAGLPLTIVPGSYDNVDEILDRAGSKVIMKSGRSLGEVKRLLEEKALEEKASMVANCGLPNQKVVRNIKDSDGSEGYFVTVLVTE